MGTRHLVAVHYKGAYPIAQYGQYDGYPSSAGATVLTFCTKRAKKDSWGKFKAQLDKCRFLTPAQDRERLLAVGIDPDAEWMDRAAADRFKAAYPQLDRYIGPGILQYVHKATDKVIELHDEFEFAGDSLFCEWAYVLDLDAGVLEVYKGFNKSPLPDGERFAHLSPRVMGGTPYYYPVRQVATFNLSELPGERDFINACYPGEE